MKKLVLLFLAMTLLLSACNSKDSLEFPLTNDEMRLYDGEEAKESLSSESYDSGYGIAPDNAPAAPPQDSAYGEETMSGEMITDTTRKLIRTANYSMETMEYEDTIAAVEALVARYGGYIQASSSKGAGAVPRSYQTNRTAYYTLRIPVEGFFDFSRELAECGSVTNSSQNAQEVTDYYYDTEARLKTLRLQEERLLTLMSQATELEAVIVLESTLADVRYQIESHEGTLRRLDSQISYSTFEVSVYEVFEPTQYVTVSDTLGQRISQRFQSTWKGLTHQGEDFLVWLVGDIVEILLTLALWVAVFFILRAIYKRLKTLRKPKPAPKEEQKDSEK